MLIVCLAKSKKHGGRCVAGVEVEALNSNSYRIMTNSGEPRWVRPVSATAAGEVPEDLVRSLSLLDVVEFAGLTPAPVGFQSENYQMSVTPPKKVQTFVKNAGVLDRFVTKRTGPLFSNRGKAVIASEIGKLDHSLMMIRCDETTFHRGETVNGAFQLRASFSFGDADFSLAVTDPEFCQPFESNSGYNPGYKTCHLTLSVGVENDGWHTKLVAGVFLT